MASRVLDDGRFIIRPLRSTDRGYVATTWIRWQSKRIHRSRTRELSLCVDAALDRGHNVVLADALHDDVLAGYAGSAKGSLTFWWVEEKLRGRGLGRALAEEALGGALPDLVPVAWMVPKESLAQLARYRYDPMALPSLLLGAKTDER